MVHANYDYYCYANIFAHPAVLFLILATSLSAAAAELTPVVVFVKGEAGYYCHKIPYLFLTAGNTLLAFAEARGKGGSSCDDFTGTDLVVKRSYDLGITWTALEVVYSNSSGEASNVVGNAAPVQDRDTNRKSHRVVKQ